MTLIDLLEQGKKATCKDFKDCKVKYICVVDGSVVNQDAIDVCLSYKDLTRNDWFEYEEHKTNFEFSDNKEKYYFISSIGIIDKITPYGSMDCNFLKVFNAFPNKELAEYIHKKQLLERKLMVFSYLNGADKIDWSNDNQPKYHISCFTKHDCYTTFSIQCIYSCKFFKTISFATEEIANKAFELYKDEIEEVMKLGLKFGF